MPTIAAEACVSRQTVYNHVGDKESLFVAIVADITERSNADIFRTLGNAQMDVALATVIEAPEKDQAHEVPQTRPA